MDAALNAARGLLIKFASAEANKRCLHTTGIAIQKYGNVILIYYFYVFLTDPGPRHLDPRSQARPI